MAVYIRKLSGGSDAAQSMIAGLVFATLLIGAGFAYGTRFTINRNAIVIGILGGLAICVPTLLFRLFRAGSQPSASGYILWSLTIIIVASSEEYFLRGALFDSAKKWSGDVDAVIIPAIAFAIMHVPFYGWHVLPLDFAVGLWLGALRIKAKTWTAPGIAHVLADLLAWWLR